MLKFDENADIDGTYFRTELTTPWSFEETVARIYTAAGFNIFQADGYKVSFEAIGTFDGQVFTLYDYKEDRTVHIGGKDDLDVEALSELLLKVLSDMNPKPYEAKEFYDEQKGYSWPL